MLRRVNRIVLGLIGTALLAAGAVVLVGTWPFAGRHEPLLSEARRRGFHAEGWRWWVLLAALALCVVLALWWLLSQLRRPHLRAVLVDTGDGAYATLRGRALEEAVAAECGALGGVAACRVRLQGRRGAPVLRIALSLEPYAVPADVVAALAGPVIERARASAGLPDLSAEARLTITGHRARRVL
ncbi:alkaline shock response membrane anchor protein AmaP [Streptomyces sp. NPDC090022]|uniref:alkaline shock response membrane anchor protein AmaP n=1 Tax=Streptomyces sp. NPDC090022 TaxID=3365920 RepID=UPI0037FF3CF6